MVEICKIVGLQNECVPVLVCFYSLVYSLLHCAIWTRGPHFIKTIRLTREWLFFIRWYLLRIHFFGPEHWAVLGLGNCRWSHPKALSFSTFPNLLLSCTCLMIPSEINPWCCVQRELSCLWTPWGPFLGPSFHSLSIVIMRRPLKSLPEKCFLCSRVPMVLELHYLVF